MNKIQRFNQVINQQRDTTVQSVEQMINTALQLHQRGHLQQAEQVYRQVLTQQPKFAYAMNMLGVLLSQKKDHIEGARLLQKAIKIEPDIAEYHINLGFNLQEQEKPEQAEKAFVKATRLDQDSADAWFNLGNISLALKKPEQAINAFNKSIGINSAYLPAYNNLGNLYREMRMFDYALEMFNKALELKPDVPQSWYNLGMIYKNLGDGENAVQCFEKVITLDPANLKARCQAGDCRGRLLNDFEGALREFDSVIELNPDYVSAYTQKAGLLMIFGRYEEAGPLCRRILEIDETNTTAYSGLIGSKLHTEQDIQNLYGLLDNRSLDTKQLVDVHFSLGSVFDDRKEYEKAFLHFQNGNRLHRNTFEYNVGNFEQFVSKLIAMFDESSITQYSNYGIASELPVFIVGMPRSGTTLVEQIIASHPQVYGAGELQYLANLVQSTLSLEDRLASRDQPIIPDLTEADISRLANQYLAYISKSGAGAKRITDKLPQNFLYLGYIAMMFPQARIIHCSRNPMDTCLSIFEKYFIFHHPYAYDQKELGVYYKQYQRLMAHWESLLSDRILTIQYADLVSDLKGKSRQLINHIGLGWDERCLRFNETERSVQTASHKQVRQNIYTSSLERWRNYETWLGPLRDALEKTV
jgi:tetratricopeptide (TPR) repeat protein